MEDRARTAPPPPDRQPVAALAADELSDDDLEQVAGGLARTWNVDPRDFD